ncbi:MAG TPA: hypothetical protein DCP69_02315 [Candidatus Omnitrophica bacterium]|nr:hypothetical protein [Candidatus Omnitrophota bacterium]
MIGYIVLRDGHPVGACAPSRLSKREQGRLFLYCDHAVAFSTRKEAMKSMRRSVKAWTVASTKNYRILRLLAPPK